MKKFEYLIKENCNKDELNSYGSEGWELVSTVSEKFYKDYLNVFEVRIIKYIFKRELSK